MTHQTDGPTKVPTDGPTDGIARRDCHHPRARHRHGTRVAYVADRCRCDDCRQANRADAAARRRAIAYGRWQPYVDAAPVRQHIEQLRAAGLGINRIVALSGVGSGTVRQLVYGDRTGRPSHRVRAATARAVLAVPLDRPAGGALVPAAGARRLVTDLEEAGYTRQDLAAHLGRSSGSLTRSLTGRRITAATLDAIEDLHRHLLPDAPDRGAPDDADDHLADLPDDTSTVLDEVAIQRVLAGDPVALTSAEQTEAIRRLATRGTSARRIAALVGTSARTVARRLKTQDVA